MKRESVAAAGAIGASLLLASCCIGPTLFLLFGVSIAALGQFARLEPYRPLFMLAGGAALSYALWGAWRPLPAPADIACEGDTCAPDAAPRRAVRGFVLLALVLYTVALVYPWVLEAML